MEIEELIKIALFPCQLTAPGIDQIEVQTQSTDIKIHESLLILRPHQLPLAGLGHDAVRNRLVLKISPIDVPNIFLLAHIQDIDPENIDFVSIADELAEKPLPRRQILPQLIDIVLVDSHADNIIQPPIVEKIADMTVIKQIMSAILGMVHGPVIDKRMVLPQLFKTADVVEDTDEPGQIPVRRGQTKTRRNFLTKGTDPQRMSILQAHALLRLIKAIDITPELGHHKIPVYH